MLKGEKAMCYKYPIKWVNLTPHDINIYSPDGRSMLASISPSGNVARVETEEEFVGYINGLPVKRIKYKRIIGLPKPEDNVFYIVSSIVLIALKAMGIKRNDVVAPNTNDAVRDSSGRIVGVKSFMTFDDITDEKWVEGLTPLDKI